MKFKRGSIAIVDEASGAYDCLLLDEGLKGDNAENYAWLAGVGFDALLALIISRTDGG